MGAMGIMGALSYLVVVGEIKRLVLHIEESGKHSVRSLAVNT